MRREKGKEKDCKTLENNQKKQNEGKMGENDHCVDRALTLTKPSQ